MTILQNGPIEMDTMRKEVRLKGELIHITRKQYQLLHFFICNQGRLLSHKEIMLGVWGPGYIDSLQYLRVYVVELRKILGDDLKSPKFIKTRVGEGYIMEIITGYAEQGDTQLIRIMADAAKDYPQLEQATIASVMTLALRALRNIADVRVR